MLALSANASGVCQPSSISFGGTQTSAATGGANAPAATAAPLRKSRRDRSTIPPPPGHVANGPHGPCSPEPLPPSPCRSLPTAPSPGPATCSRSSCSAYHAPAYQVGHIGKIKPLFTPPPPPAAPLPPGRPPAGASQPLASASPAPPLFHRPPPPQLR